MQTKKSIQNALQKKENTTVKSFLARFNKAGIDLYNATSKPLRSCSARVYETERYTILRSYSTIIAAYDKKTNKYYDFLRYVYGFTATSSYHLAKFRSDFVPSSATHYVYKSI